MTRGSARRAGRCPFSSSSASERMLGCPHLGRFGPCHRLRPQRAGPWLREHLRLPNQTWPHFDGWKDRGAGMGSAATGGRRVAGVGGSAAAGVGAGVAGVGSAAAGWARGVGDVIGSRRRQEAWSKGTGGLQDRRLGRSLGNVRATAQGDDARRLRGSGSFNGNGDFGPVADGEAASGSVSRFAATWRPILACLATPVKTLVGFT